MSDNKISELKRILLDFKFKRVSDLADKIIDEKGWTTEEIAEKVLTIKK